MRLNGAGAGADKQSLSVNSLSPFVPSEMSRKLGVRAQNAESNTFHPLGSHSLDSVAD